MFLGDIKQELIENDDLISLFGIERFLKLSETDIIVEFKDRDASGEPLKFRIIAKGAEQKLRGAKWDNKRPDLILCDDLENDEIVQNSERREKFRRWFYGALVPARAQNGKIIIVGTILHMDSLLERLMPGYNLKTTVEEGLKIFSTKKTMWKSVKYKAHNPDFSQTLWPTRFNKETLVKIRQGYIDQGMPDIYSQEYLNYPIDETTAYFRRDDFLPLTANDLEQNLVHYAAADFAVSTRERSDYTVISVVAVDPAGKLQVRDIRRGRWDAADIIEEMFSVQRRYKPELFVVEQGTIEKALGPFLRKEMSQRNVYMNLFPMVPTKDKMSRARSLQARMRAGGIKFDMDATWYPTLEDEMVRFPKDRHDDQVDSLSWIGLALDKILEAPTNQELEQEEWDEEFSGKEELGRSLITGY
jgi:predicted phage terminase large subunit-like protein